MTFALRTLSFAAVAALTFGAAPAFAQDAMAPDAMAPDAMAGGAMMADHAMMSDADLALCLEQSAMITFPHAMEAASMACHDMHNGMMDHDAMAPDAMAPDAMASDAMAPKK